MKKNVVIITGVFLPEPIVSARLMADLAERLSDNYDVIVLRPYPSRPCGFRVPAYDLSDKPYKVVEIDSYVCAKSKLLGRFRESYSYGRACLAYLKLLPQLDFVYNGAWHLFGRKMIAEYCVEKGIPNITPVQDIYPESLLSKLPSIVPLQWAVKKILMPYDKITLHNANLIHTISNDMVDYLSRTRNLSKDKFVVVRNWQDEREFVEYAKIIPSVVPHPFTFMFMGNIGALAGLDVVIKAFAMANLNNARLVIAGSGSAREALRKQATEHKNCDIQFWDVPFGKVPATQAKADVMLLPVKKGFAKSSIPSKLPAYMFSHKPVLAAVDADSDTAECIRKANAGWVCEPENVYELALSMELCINTDKEKLNTMGTHGFNYAIEDFSRTVNLKKLSDACIKVIESK